MELAQLTEIDVQPFLTRSFEGFALTLGSVLILGLQDNAFIALEPEAIKEEVTSTIGNRDLRWRINLGNVLAPCLSPYWDFLHSEAISVPFATASNVETAVGACVVVKAIGVNASV